MSNTADWDGLTFGIEWEFYLFAYKDYYQPSEKEKAEKRNLRFEPVPGGFGSKKEDYVDGLIDMYKVEEEAVHHHIAQTFRAHDLSASVKGTGYHSWCIKEDASIDPPNHTQSRKYEGFGVEISSPALPYTKESVEKVLKACKLITETYCVNVNRSTGFHVHVGTGPSLPSLDHGPALFDLEHIKRLQAFLWAFEPQLDSLHPKSRQNNYYCRAHRGCSVQTSKSSPRTLMSPLQGVLSFLNTKKRPRDFIPLSDSQRYKAYNWANIAVAMIEPEKCDYYKKTLEFRQHKGCLDPEGVEHWIHLTVGIVRFTRDVSVLYLADLLNKTLDEKFTLENMPDTPVCETDFTVIHLMQEIGIRKDTIQYYATRGLYRHRPSYYYGLLGDSTGLGLDGKDSIKIYDSDSESEGEHKNTT